MPPLIPEVSPGDVITADFMNLVKAAVDNLETRVAALESMPATTGLAITSVRPVEPRIGDKMRVTGTGFRDPYWANIVTIDGIATPILEAESSQHELVFFVPDVPYVPKIATLEITAHDRSVTFEFPLLPEILVPAGEVVAFTHHATTTPFGDNPNLVGGGTYTFTFRLVADVRDAPVTLRTYVAALPAGWTAVLVDEAGLEVAGAMPLQVGNGQERLVRVRVAVPSAGPGNAELRVWAVAQEQDAEFAPGNCGIALTRGGLIPSPDDRVHVSLAVADIPNVNVENGRLMLPPDQDPGPLLGFSVYLADAGTYDVELAIDAAGWTADLTSGSRIGAPDPDTRARVDVRLRGTSGALPAEMMLVIRRDDAMPPVHVSYVVPVGLQNP